MLRKLVVGLFMCFVTNCSHFEMKTLRKYSEFSYHVIHKFPHS